MKDKYQDTFNTWNKLAELYAEKFMDLSIYNKSYDFICESITKKNAKLLEIGCGPGNITKYLLSKRPDYRIHGLDVAPNMIELARILNPTATFEVMDIRSLDSITARFDGVIGGFCLPYLSTNDAEKIIADCKNLLNDSGIFYLSFVDGNPADSCIKTSSTGDSVFFNFHRLADIINQLKKNSFININSEEVEFQRTEKNTEMHTIVTAKKNSYR